MVLVCPFALAVVMAFMRHGTSPAGHAKSAAWPVCQHPRRPRSSTRASPLLRLPATPLCLTIPLLPVICGFWMCMRLPPFLSPYEVGVRETRGPRYEYGCQVD